ncbi:hypothetical protein ECG_07631 [Echinococcus granulosus]|nr:hypothetical protein ECG_07631 [Echinococcus granulosus]
MLLDPRGGVGAHVHSGAKCSTRCNNCQWTGQIGDWVNGDSVVMHAALKGRGFEAEANVVAPWRRYSMKSQMHSSLHPEQLIEGPTWRLRIIAVRQHLNTSSTPNCEVKVT